MAESLAKIIRDAAVGIGSFYGLPMPTTGSTVFVDSTTGTDDADHGDISNPVATLDYGIGLCTASKGDMLIVMPGHAENLGVAGVDADVAGISIIGLGNGSNRPTFTFTGAAGADWDFDAANIKVFNCRFIGSEDGLTGPFDVNAAYCGMYGCEYRDDGTENVLRWLVLDANGDDFELINARNYGTSTAGNAAFLSAGACDNLLIRNLHSYGDFSVGNLELTAAATNLLVDRCWLRNLNACDCNIEGFAGATGEVCDCRMNIATDTQTTWIHTQGNLTVYESYGTNQPAEAGKFIGTVSV